LPELHTKEPLTFPRQSDGKFGYLPTAPSAKKQGDKEAKKAIKGQGRKRKESDEKSKSVEVQSKEEEEEHHNGQKGKLWPKSPTSFYKKPGVKVSDWLGKRCRDVIIIIMMSKP